MVSDVVLCIVKLRIETRLSNYELKHKLHVTIYVKTMPFTYELYGINRIYKI